MKNKYGDDVEDEETDESTDGEVVSDLIIVFVCFLGVGCSRREGLSADFGGFKVQ